MPRFVVIYQREDGQWVVDRDDGSDMGIWTEDGLQSAWERLREKHDKGIRAYLASLLTT